MKLHLLTIAACALLGACAYNPPAATAPETYSRAVAEAPAVAWQHAAAALTAQGYALSFADKSLGSISTAKRVVTVTSAQVDCGNVWGQPYVADPRTVISVSLAVRIAPDGAGSRVAVSSDVEGNFIAMAGATATHLNCRSLGELERRVLGAF